MKCSDCDRPAVYWCADCKQPMCDQEVKLCALFLHTWRELGKHQR